MADNLKILLLQARAEGDPMLEHELACFSQTSGLPQGAFAPLNMTTGLLGAGCLDGVGAVMIGGSGDFSVVLGGFGWHAPMLELLREIVRRKVPTFASCFGHQALAQSLGGDLEREDGGGELGTFEIALTERGRQDRLFGQMPPRFMAQLGHFDLVRRLPPGMDNLASSALCAIQAARVRGAPIVTTQFHPELTASAQLERWMRYVEHYRQEGETIEAARARARGQVHPSPESATLLRRFLETELGLEGLSDRRGPSAAPALAEPDPQDSP